MDGKLFALDPIKGEIIYKNGMRKQRYGYFNVTTLNTQIVSTDSSEMGDNQQISLDQITIPPQYQSQSVSTDQNIENDITTSFDPNSDPVFSEGVDIKDIIFTSLNLHVSGFHKKKGVMIWHTKVFIFHFKVI